RVLALDAPRVQPALAAGAEHDGAALLAAHEDEPDARVLAQRRQQARVALVELLAGDAAGHPREGDEPQAARGHDADLGARAASSPPSPSRSSWPSRRRASAAPPLWGARRRGGGGRALSPCVASVRAALRRPSAPSSSGAWATSPTPACSTSCSRVMP